MHVAEQNDAATKASSKQPDTDEIKKDENDEEDLDEFEKKWDNIEYLIRRQFCCK